MARLFGKEFHKVSNTWFFKESVVWLEEGELLYEVLRDEKGFIILRFFAVPEKRKHLPYDLYVTYDDKKETISSHYCVTCAKDNLRQDAHECRHLLTVINYGYKYLSSSIATSAVNLVYTNDMLGYNEQELTAAINGKILLEGVYDADDDKIRFRFSGYEKIELYPISLIAAEKKLPPAYSKKQSQILKQISSLAESEISLLAFLQQYKCAHSTPKQSWTVYKKDFVKILPLLRTLAATDKVFIKETGEKLIFSDDNYNLNIKVSKVSVRTGDINTDNGNREPGEDYAAVPQYLLKPSAGCFYSACFSGNLTYLFVENSVYTVRIPLAPAIVEQVFNKGYYCREYDLVYLATTVAKQFALTGNYLDFDEEIVLPEHYSGRPQVIFKLSLIRHRKESGNRGKKTILVRCRFNFANRELPYLSIIKQGNLIAVKDNAGKQIWFHFPEDLHRKVNAFIEMLPVPDITSLPATDSNDDESLRQDELCFTYENEEKIDVLKQLFYEQANPEWSIVLDDGLKKEFIYKVELHPLIRVNKSGEIDWFDYQVDYQIKDVTYTHQELKEFFSKHRKYLRLPDGKLIYFSNKDVYDRIERQIAHFSDSPGRGERLSYYNLSYLYNFTRFDDKIRIEGDKYFDRLFEDLLRRKMESGGEVPLGLYNVMRGYQKSGFRWLKMLQQYRMSGILADDMGLGKTLQAIAILSDFYEPQVHSHITPNIVEEPTAASPDKVLPSIVVCPKTLIYNWANEIEKFHCNLTYAVYEGSKEERGSILKNLKDDIIIVSYALISADIELFRRYNYGYLILDEAQHIKNPASLRSKAVKKINASHRLALTGTPLENNVSELWSIYDFLMPGYLQSLRKFKKTYDFTEGSENNQDNAQNRLGQMISPFILRRRKNEVLRELPDKQEQTLLCKMTPYQEKMYLKIIAMAKSSLIPEIDSQSGSGINPKIYINVLAALTRMRQVCNLPSLVSKETDSKGSVSGKMELLTELITDAVDNRRNILVFSQFSTMLRKIAEMLTEKGFVYEYMDGKTINRQDRINNFTDNENVRIFLLTLKVGGLGLNLTKADTVILVDPWWNPMAEMQSIDRTHRIGQTKKVMVYKLITKGTVEEKILQLQESKKAIFNNVIEQSTELIRKLTVEDIKSLFDYDSEK